MPPRGSKENALAQSSTAASQHNDKHQTFTQWAKVHGVEINGVKAESLPGRGLGLITTKHLKNGDRLLFIPEKVMFKPDVALLQREGLGHTSPQAQLAISAMLAFNEPNSSYELWHKVWPTRHDFEESMPMCWPNTLQQQLPPSVQQPLERQRADYVKDWSTASEFCSTRAIDEGDFMYYWMIVNSRSFHWKPPRGKSGMMVMCPFIDYMNHGPTGSGCHVTQTAKGYEVAANRDYDADTEEAPGEEILATYGPHSNDKLLVHYGFICAYGPEGPSADDDIRLDHIILSKLDAQVRSQLQDVGFLGAYALLPASNEICFKTQVAVRAALLTANEWEYYIENGEDLSIDHSPVVHEFVKSLLIDYRKICLQNVSNLQGLSDSPAQRVLILRWQQIVEAIDAFVKT